MFTLTDKSTDKLFMHNVAYLILYFSTRSFHCPVGKV